MEGASKVDFSTVMKNSLEQVSESQLQARELATAFESGDTSVDLPEVMIALQKANISFQAITQVRKQTAQRIPGSNEYAGVNPAPG